ncbi:hypothetical protein DPMN_019168 [Dreissena polymorpha]|uniref:Uncharacterized protein n=1 Tax=Dreissena polymorpha TaxID=45954 RepID=A0A9D4NEJ0_DREPO|nr:hypothetical protein DPMN_019168 [Dreissena polymorpha]
MADESTDEGNRNQFAIVAKFLYQGKVQDVFLGLVHNLMLSIERFLIAKVTIHQFAEEFAIPIVHSLIGEIEDAFQCSEVLQSLAVFNLRNVPDSVAEVVNNFGQLPIRQLANHYGNTKEDTFNGHRNVANPVYTSAQILCEFEGFKHEMRSIKRNATTEQLDDPQFLLQTIREDAVLNHDYPAMQYLVLLDNDTDDEDFKGSDASDIDRRPL